jgi:hypothetical protein
LERLHLSEVEAIHEKGSGVIAAQSAAEFLIKEPIVLG